MSSGETPNQPGSDCIEKRSQSDELEQPEPKRSRPVLEFPASTLKSSGLYYLKEKLVLYRQENFDELFRFLDGLLSTRRPDVSKEVNPYRLGWILGPPGVGKSSAIFAFTRSERVSKCAVSWIHSKNNGALFTSVHRDEKVKKTVKFQLDERREYMAKLKVKNKKHLLVLDGYTNHTSNTVMLSATYSWLRADFENRRLVVICSTASRGKSDKADDLAMGATPFQVCSWTLEEYKTAVKHPQLYDAVKEKLGTEADISTDEVVESKHYFAGGSARFMFQMDTKEVKEDLHEAIKNVSDIQTLATGLAGSPSAVYVHRLIFIKDEIEGIVSQYAGNQLAAKLGTQLVERFTHIPMKGFLFEMWFFAKLSGEGVSYDLIHGGPGKTWAPSIPEYLPSKDEELVRDSPTWFQSAWNNGGFDAVYVDRQKETVRFVQITLNNHHSFKIHLFYKFLKRLRNYMHIQTLEIFFVYPKGAVHQKPETTGKGLLTEFQWKSGEEWEKVTKVTFNNEY